MWPGPSLRSLGVALTISAFTSGLLAAWMWSTSNARWQEHRADAFAAGLLLFNSLQNGTPPPERVVLKRLDKNEATLASNGHYARIASAPRPALVTNTSIRIDQGGAPAGRTLKIAIISSKLSYPLADIVSRPSQTAPEAMGRLTELMATFCSDAVIFVGAGATSWQQIEGRQLWGCGAAPWDLRLPAALFAVIALGITSTLVFDISARFKTFSQALRERRRIGGPETYETTGPEELQEIVASVNSYLEVEREHLSKRALVLSSVSHDLGTPAARLRLRTALIEDTELRAKLEADIDSMTGIIESVLTYTRSELDAENPRKLSLTSLVEAVVADYVDMGEPVEIREADPIFVEGGRSVFTSRQASSALTERRRILVTARPVALKRALSNLIDNALKYGRRATVEIAATAEEAVITVEDESSGVHVEEVEALVSPFRRGINTGSSGGFGLGLTIVNTVAEQHGGQLTFEGGQRGLRASLSIQRST